MAEEQQWFNFTYQELAEMMVKATGVTEGLWGVRINFGIAATNVGSGGQDMRPAAIVPVVDIGLQRFEKPSNLTVDAGEIAKAPRSKAKRAKAKTSAST